jgi:hypothetical protein
MITMFAARISCVLAVLAPLVLALQPTHAAAQGQPAPVQRVPTYTEQQEKINAWTVGLAAGLIEGTPSRPVMERARVDDGANLIVLPIIRLGTTEKLYLRGADLAVINSGACSLLAQIERMECLEKLSRDIAPAVVSPSPD